MAPIAFRSVADVRKCFQKSLMPGYLKIPTHTVILAAGSVKQADIRGVHQKPEDMSPYLLNPFRSLQNPSSHATNSVRNVWPTPSSQPK